MTVFFMPRLPSVHCQYIAQSNSLSRDTLFVLLCFFTSKRVTIYDSTSSLLTSRNSRAIMAPTIIAREKIDYFQMLPPEIRVRILRHLLIRESYVCAERRVGPKSVFCFQIWKVLTWTGRTLRYLGLAGLSTSKALSSYTTRTSSSFWFTKHRAYWVERFPLTSQR